MVDTKDLVIIKAEDITNFGKQKLIEYIIQNIEEFGKTVMISGTIDAMLGKIEALDKYHTTKYDHLMADAYFFRKDT